MYKITLKGKKEWLDTLIEQEIDLLFKDSKECWDFIELVLKNTSGCLGVTIQLVSEENEHGNN